MRVALIQGEARTDDAALRLARALRAQEHEATLLVPQPSDFVVTPEGYRAGRLCTPPFAVQWRGEGFDWIPVGPARLDSEVQHFPRDPAIAVARSLADLVTVFDVVWFFERYWAAPALRERRFRDRALPLVVLDERPDPDPIPHSIDGINRSGAEHYALRWADLVAAPSVEAAAHVAALWQTRLSAPPRVPRQPLTSPAVTVCVPYFDAPAYMPLTLASLARQTSTDFTIIVVDDGSVSEAGRRAFDKCEETYAGPGGRASIRPRTVFLAARVRPSSPFSMSTSVRGTISAYSVLTTLPSRERASRTRRLRRVFSFPGRRRSRPLRPLEATGRARFCSRGHHRPSPVSRFQKLLPATIPLWSRRVSILASSPPAERTRQPIGAMAVLSGYVPLPLPGSEPPTRDRYVHVARRIAGSHRAWLLRGTLKSQTVAP